MSIMPERGFKRPAARLHGEDMFLETSAFGEISIDPVDGLFSWNLGSNFWWNAFSLKHSVVCWTQPKYASSKDWSGVKDQKHDTMPISSDTNSVLPSQIHSQFHVEREWSFFLSWWTD